jgi:DNA primase
LLGRYTRRVVVNYDPDSAGIAATERSIELLLEEGFECRVLALPGGLDPDAFVRNQGAAAYQARLKDAPNYLDYLADRAAAAHDLGTPEGKIAALNAVLPYVVRLPDPMLRLQRTHRLADRLRVDDPLLRREVKRASERAQREISPEKLPASLAASDAEKQLLRGCLESEALADELLPSLFEDGALEGLATAKIFRVILEARQRGEKLNLPELEEQLTEPERRLAYECQFAGADPLSRQHALLCADALRRTRKERKRAELQAAIRQAEQAGDLARLGELLKTKAKLAAELAGSRPGAPPRSLGVT